MSEQRAPEGKIWCVIRQRYVEDRPEEWVRQQILGTLLTSYRYPEERVSVEVPVRIRPSEQPRFADIVIFLDDEQLKPFITIEVKDPDTDEDGYPQAERYAVILGAEYAKFAFAVSGDEIAGPTKRIIYPREGVDRQIIPVSDIPRFGEEVQFEITRLRAFTDIDENRRVLQAIHDDMRSEGKDPLQAFEEMTKLLFAKVYDERNPPNDRPYRFQAGYGESEDEVAARILTILRDAIARYDYNTNMFQPGEEILLSPHTLCSIVRRLQPYSIIDTGLDIKGRAFQVFLGATLRGKPFGQYFTPRPIVQFMVNMIDPDENDKIIDPACGTGGFLLYALNTVREKIEARYASLLSVEEMTRKKIEFATNNVIGIDLHDKVAKSAKINMLVSEDGRGSIYISDALIPLEDLPAGAGAQQYSTAITNPPFGQNITEPNILRLYRTAHRPTDEGTDSVMGGQDTKILFIERCLQFLSPSGKLAIVLPNGVFNNAGEEAKRIRRLVRDMAVIDAVVTMPDHAFVHVGTGSKTMLLFARKKDQSLTQGDIFMARLSNIGYDVKGRAILGSQLSRVLDAYRQWNHTGICEPTGDFLSDEEPLIYTLSAEELDADPAESLDPRHYDPHHQQRLTQLAQQYEVVRLGDYLVPLPTYIRRGQQLVAGPEKKVITGKAPRSYVKPGPDTVPVIMIGNIVELNGDYHLDLLGALHISSADHQFALESELQPEDLLFAVTGATIGKVAIFPSGLEGSYNICGDIARVRVRDLDPYYVFAFLSSELGQRQIKANVSGSTNEHLAPESIELLRIPLIAEAEEIARAYRSRIETLVAASARSAHAKALLAESLGLSHPPLLSIADQNTTSHQEIGP